MKTWAILFVKCVCGGFWMGVPSIEGCLSLVGPVTQAYAEANIVADVTCMETDLASNFIHPPEKPR